MTSLIRRRYGALSPLQQEMNEVFDRFFGGPRGTAAWPVEGEGFFPATNVSENNNEVVVTAELPGVDPKDVDISVQDNVLTIKGEKKEEKEEKGETFHRVERTSGTFSRAVNLPTQVNMEKVSAEYQNGILRIVLPKAPEAKRHQVKVNVR